MKPHLRIEVVPFPCDEAQANQDAAFSELADSLADRFIHIARNQIADELNVPAESIDQEVRRADVSARQTLGLGTPGGGR